MSTMYRFVSGLKPNLIDKWKVNVMVARIWEGFNPNTNRIYSLYMIIVDERRCMIHAKVPNYIMEKVKRCIHEGHVYVIHKFTVDYYKTMFRPLNREFFVLFNYETTVHPSRIRVPSVSHGTYSS